MTRIGEITLDANSIRRLLIGIALAAFVVPLSDAQAQLGGFLKKKIAEKTAEKVVEQTGIAPPDGVREDTALKFDERVVMISAARIDQVIRGLEAEGTAVAGHRLALAAEAASAEAAKPALKMKEKAFEQKMAQHQKIHDAFMACQNRQLDSAFKAARLPQPPPNAALARMTAQGGKMTKAERDDISERMDDYGKRVAKAEKSGDRAGAKTLRAQLAREIAEKLEMTATEVEQALDGATLSDRDGRNKCGLQPVPPSWGDDAHPDAVGSMEQFVANAGWRASGMSDEAYGVMRERIAAFLRNGSWPFSKGELQSLRSRQSDLRRYEKQLTDA